MHTTHKKFTFFCTEDRLHLAIGVLKSLDGVRLLHAFEKEFRMMMDRKSRVKRVRRHRVSGVCPNHKMDDLVHLLASHRIYGFNRAASVEFSDLQRPTPMKV